MLFSVGIPELAIILGIGVVFFGPSTLPKLGRAVGETIHEVRSGLEETPKPVEKHIEKIESVKTVEEEKK